MYTELLLLVPHPPVVLPPQNVLWHTADTVVLFLKAALTCGLSRPRFVCRGVWDAHPETCGADKA